MGTTYVNFKSNSCDVHYNSTSLILSMDGTNGSTTFTDYSPSPKTVTPVGNAVISTAQSKFGGSSAYFDGSGDYLSIPANTDFNISEANDFTVEFWHNPTNQANLDGNAIICVGSINGYWQVIVRDNKVQINIRNAIGLAYTDLVAPVTLTNGVWYHVAWVRVSGSYVVYVDGIARTPSQNTIPTFFTTGNNAAFVGANFTGGVTSTEGYIDDLRVTKGVARYTGNFSVPTEPNPTLAC